MFYTRGGMVHTTNAQQLCSEPHSSNLHTPYLWSVNNLSRQLRFFSDWLLQKFPHNLSQYSTANPTASILMGSTQKY